MTKTAGTIFGHVMGVYIGGDTLTRIAAMKSVSIDLSAAMRDMNNADTGDNDTVAPGRRRWTVSGNGHFQFDAGYGYGNLWDAWKAGTALYFMFSDENDDIKYFAKGYIDNLKSAFPDHENSTYDWSIGGNAKDMVKLDATDEAELLSGWTNDTYDTFAATGANITSAIDDGVGNNFAQSNTFALDKDDVLKYVYTLTKTSGATPVLKLTDGTNEITVTLATGANKKYISIPYAGTWKFVISADGVAQNFALTNSLKQMNL